MSQPLTLKKLFEKRRFAGVMLSYRCTIACRHCLFACKPDNPNTVMSVDQAAAYLEGFSKLDRVVHLSGGEPFMFYDVLIGAAREAGERGVPAHTVQTNCSWCASDEIVEERFNDLKETGILGMFFSSDPYHQEFVPAENVRRAVTIATEVFGPDNVVGGGAAAFQHGDELKLIVKDEERLREHVRSSSPRMVGRAFFALSRFLDERPISQLASDSMWGDYSGTENCATEFDPAVLWEVHGDPYGNLQTNCGVILGKVKDTPISEIMSKDYLMSHPIVRILSAEGPFGLLKIAEEKGYKRREQYVQKCSLCFEVRSFLRPHYPQFLGPEEIYED